MSHFFVMVVIPKEKPVDKGVITELIAKYSEHLDVPEYEKECWCVGRVAQRAAREAAEKVLPMYDARELYQEKVKSVEDKQERSAIWDEVMAPRNKAYNEVLESHELRKAPNSDCAECRGTGIEKSTYNPDAKWDWWRVGGRWDSAIRGKRAESEDNGFNFADHHEDIGRNSRPVSDILEHWTEDSAPFALVTPDGEWHERGEMGWFAVVSDEKSSVCWDDQAHGLLEKHADCVAVGIDCHI
jgi:hypothetical protein